MPEFSVSRRLAHRLAVDLAATVGHVASVVVLAHPDTGVEIDRAVVGPLLPVNFDPVLALVTPTDAKACDVARLHDPGLRLLAAQWHADHLLLVPCTFGNDLHAVALAPVGADADRRFVERTAQALGERFAAALVRARLFAGVAAAPALAGVS